MSKITMVGSFTLVVLAATLAILLFTIAKSGKSSAVNTSSNSWYSPSPGTYLNYVPTDCQNTDVSDETACIWKHADATAAEADTLAQKLITEAPKRLEALPSIPNAPVSFAYGGDDFLKDLPTAVAKAQKTKENYISSLCSLDAMMIYGGSGTDMEIQACRLYTEEQYLSILHGLEGGLMATDTPSS